MKLAIAIVLLTAGIARADSAADVDKFLKWFDGFADLAQADQNNCPRMGTDLNKSLDDNKAIVDAAKRAMDSGDEIPGDAADHMIDTNKRLSAAVKAKCSADANVTHAMTRLPGRNRK
ncbi:MAG TPA: hypothetical protein VGG28_34670 [Kofleriaceae bacterium]|jgi:hypothetical protein